jgi:short-subunit dehydrogenase
MAAKAITLITGASAGIGTALAHVFAERGHALVLTARREAQLKAVADAITVAGRARPEIIALDLGEHEGPARLADELAHRGLEPEIVVNNAGFGLQGISADLDRARQLAIIDLNVRTLTDLSLRFLGSVKRHRGGILNVASIAGFMPGPQMAVYHASKAYVVSFSEALRTELAGDGVRVSVLCPGPVPTEFNDRAGVPDDYFPRFLNRSAARVAREGYDGLMQGRRVIIPGTLNKIATVLPRLLPRGVMLMAVDPKTRIV